MLIKCLIISTMILIMLSLGSGLFFLLRDKGTGTRTVKALTWRIGLSFTLFISLFVAFALGFIQPHAF